MKGLKNFALFFVYPVMLIVIGFVGGAACISFFYPGSVQSVKEKSAGQAAVEQDDKWQIITGTPETAGEAEGEDDIYAQDSSLAQGEALMQNTERNQDGELMQGAQLTQDGEFVQDADFRQEMGILQEAAAGSDGSDVDGVQEVSMLGQKLNANTSYVLEENDLRNDTVVQTSWKLPAKYIGMNREQFLEAMELYEASPPLEELERGFVSLEVRSFSPQKVVVQMNYQYVQPGSSFYLMVEDNYVVVYLDDKTTLYMDTDISLKDLPEELQQQIIQVMFVPDEESLYDFLENYSS